MPLPSVRIPVASVSWYRPPQVGFGEEVDCQFRIQPAAPVEMAVEVKVTNTAELDEKIKYVIGLLPEIKLIMCFDKTHQKEWQECSK